MTFMDYWDKTRQNQYAFGRKIMSFNMWYFCLYFTWPWVKCEILRPTNVKFSVPYHPCVAGDGESNHVQPDIRAIISHGDLIWPDLDLDLSLVLALYSYDIFVIPWVELWQSLGLQLALAGVGIRKVKRVSFDLWPGLGPRIHLFKNILRLY